MADGVENRLQTLFVYILYDGQSFMCHVCAVAVKATEDLLAFMIRHTSGVICASLEEDRLEVQFLR